MVKVTIGTEVIPEKKGEGKNGAWVLATVKAEKGYDSIQIWAENANEVDVNKTYKIKSISAVAITNKKYEKDGQTKWFAQYSANCVLEPSVPAGFAKVDDSQLPF